MSLWAGSEQHPYTLQVGGRRQPEYLPQSRSQIQETMGDSSEAEGLLQTRAPQHRYREM